MLVLASGLQKSGTAWFVQLTNDLLVTAGYSDNCMIRDKFNLTFLKYDECNIQKPTLEKLNILTSPPVSNYSFVIKTHHHPNQHISELMAQGKIKVTYIYRDPRDVALSAYEAGKKLRSRGVFKRFGKLRTMEEAIEWTCQKLQNCWQEWTHLKGILCFKYEDLLGNTMDELEKLCDFLEIEVNERKIKKIIETHSAEKIKKTKSYTNVYHFNKGKIGRFREEMTEEEIELCHKTFGDYIERMGYSE